MAGHFEVVFQGEIYAAVDPVKARADMAKLFKQPSDKVERLFDGRTWVLKDGLDRPTAERYQVELAKIGLISELRDRTPAIRTDAPPQKTQDFTIESIGITKMTCPDCRYEQLEADYCARCGVSINLARAKEKLREKENDEITQRIKALRKKNAVEGGDPVAEAAPQSPRVESTREFRGAGRGPGPAVWILGTLGLIVVVIGALVATGIVAVNL
jgi:hypothetical protein